MNSRPRVAVVSPFLDKRHGTERCVAEQVERLADDYEIHLYSTSVQDVDLSKIVWHRIPRLPGPHLASYLGFFAANHLQRWWHRRFRELQYDLVFSPGINCLDPDVIAVHIVFAEFYRFMRSELGLLSNPLRMWPWLIHRRLSYRFFIALEQRVYTRDELPLAVISRKMEQDLVRCFNRSSRVSLMYYGVDLEHLNPPRRHLLRGTTRQRLKIPENTFAVLLVGNDWAKKGLPCLIEAVGSLPDANLKILICGEDKSFPCRDLIQQRRLENRVMILPLVREIEQYYAAADIYVGPSLEDSFALPPLEAMACGLPVIVSRQAGVSELVTHGVDGFVLDDPRDSRQLAHLIHQICVDEDLRQRLGSSATETARHYTWERNAQEMKKIFEERLREKRQNILDRRSALAQI